MELTDIIEHGAEYTQNSGFTVEVNASYSWVTIKNEDTREDLFLQGDEADDFIKKADKLWETTGVINYDTICLYLAEPYLEIVE